jgi:hypothetical protein
MEGCCPVPSAMTCSWIFDHRLAEAGARRIAVTAW